ncbi:hypothetical protein F8388_003081 [Cannabis sativa]|uniref:peroxidase n=1 Tax=Cannabis sativa TaxID=3483 RepID=A0A7J6HRB9_CANSA|nr:hypothetical protein F8388_003081 [Cannabis sativa]KAF4397823.1 hypothetical protein G4B88_017304 [Cannabis sativa]
MASSSLFMTLLSLGLLMLVMGNANAQLSTNFYSKTCPKLLPTVKSKVHSAISKESRMGASLLRLFFHDCFVNELIQSDKLDAHRSGPTYTTIATLTVRLPKQGNPSVLSRVGQEITIWHHLISKAPQLLTTVTSKTLSRRRDYSTPTKNYSTVDQLIPLSSLTATPRTLSFLTLPLPWSRWEISALSLVPRERLERIAEEPINNYKIN